MQNEACTRIADLMNLRSYAGVPLIMVDPTRLPLGSKAECLEYFRAEIATYGLPNSPMVQAFTELLEEDGNGIFNTCRAELKRHGQVSPFCSLLSGYPPGHCEYADEVGRRSFKPHKAAFVIAPTSDYSLDKEVQLCYGKTPHLSSALRDQDDVYRYYILRHELMHVAGGNEYQCDMAAAIACRKYFPDSKSPLMSADYRAIHLARQALAFADPAHVKDHRALYDSLKSYDWAVIDANDAVMAMSQQEIEAYTEDDMIDLRFKYPDRKADIVISLGSIFARHDGIKEFVMGQGGPATAPSFSERQAELHGIISTSTPTQEHFAIASRLHHALRNWASSERTYSSASQPLNPREPWGYV